MICGNGIAKMEGKKICGNGNVEMQGKKMWQLICGNGVAENWEEGEKEREFSRKKNILDSNFGNDIIRYKM